MERTHKAVSGILSRPLGIKNSEKEIQVWMADRMIRDPASKGWSPMWNVEIDAGNSFLREKQKAYADFVIYDRKYNPLLVIELKRRGEVHCCMEGIGQLVFYCHALGLPLSRAMLCVGSEDEVPSKIAENMKRMGMGTGTHYNIVNDINTHLGLNNELGDSISGKGDSETCQASCL